MYVVMYILWTRNYFFKLLLFQVMQLIEQVPTPISASYLLITTHFYTSMVKQGSCSTKPALNKFNPPQDGFVLPAYWTTSAKSPSFQP